MPERRAAITGAGVVSPFGVGLHAFFDGLAAGGTRVGPIRSFDASTMPTRVAAEVPVARADGAWVRANGVPFEGEIRDRKVAFALLAAHEAWRDAGCGEGERDAWLSLALGLEVAFLEDFTRLLDGAALDWGRAPRIDVRARVDLAVDALRAMLAPRGPDVVHVSACAAGALSVAHAASLVERGAADVVVCGASDSMVNPLGLGGMTRLGATSPRNEPDACRPFDRRRDGLAMGEGAAIFVVEEESRARARGARVRARIAGWGRTQDAFKATAPRPDGAPAAEAMRRAVSRVGRERVGWVNAHGTGTPLNDPIEARAIREAIGAHAPVSSIKGAIGHLMAASGAVEIASCLLAFERGIVPGTVHLRDVDPEVALDVIGPEARRMTPEVVLSNSFGFGGQNACVALETPA